MKHPGQPISIVTSRVFLVLLSPLLVYAVLDPALQDSQRVLHPHLLSIGMPYPALLFVEQHVGDLFHFTLAIILTTLLAISHVIPSKPRRIQLVLVAIIIGLSAPMIELLQMLTGRGFSIRDIAVHEFGVACAVVLWWPIKR